MNQNRKIIVMLICLVLLGIAGGFWLINSKKPQQTLLLPQPVKKTPLLILGTVENVVGSTIYFTNSGLHNRATLTSGAEIVRQEKTENGPYKFTNLKISDIKKGDKIVLYYDIVSKNGAEYTTSKVEILQNK